MGVDHPVDPLEEKERRSAKNNGAVPATTLN